MWPERISRALAIPDLSDPQNGTHAVNLVVSEMAAYFQAKGWPVPEIRRSSPISSVTDNFDRLHFPADAICRSPIYTRYIDDVQILRVHTSAMIPDLLVGMRERDLTDYLVMSPGMCYRRDVVDKTHCGEPHQMDVWRIKQGAPRLERESLLELIDAVIRSILPNAEYVVQDAIHPYTINGLEVGVRTPDGDILEVLECGEAHPQILAEAGLDPSKCSGLALGVGLDRMVMLRKNIPDIRILRASDPRIAKQMVNLDPYVSVSKFPAINRDMSVSIPAEAQEEDICEAVKDAMGPDIDMLEEVQIRSATAYDDLPPQAIERLGIHSNQKNVLVRIVLRSHERSLTHEEANTIRDRVHLAIDHGDMGYVRKVVIA